LQGKNNGLSAAGKDFVITALAMHADERPSVSDLLSHEWITMHCKKPAAVAVEMGKLSIQQMGPSNLEQVEDSWTSIVKCPNGALVDPTCEPASE
jgi:hypothetical protein